jgi:hypothetical protein
MTCEETRIGFAFNNPDIDNDYHAPAWGLLVSPDELRYDELFGNPLIAEADSQSITDEQLLDYARLAIAYMERELNIDILPHRIRYEDLIGEDGAAIPRQDIADEDESYLSRMKTRKQKKELYVREQGYPYRAVAARHESQVLLRRRPLRDVLTAKFVDPYHSNTIYDLMPYRIVKKGLSSKCFFRPRNLTIRSCGYMYLWQRFLYNQAYRNMQDIFKIDYETGYENCEDVPDDIRNITKKIAAVTLMNIYGDGKLAAIASRSVSLNTVSESIGTTLSATSATFGARIIQYRKEIKEWFNQNRAKYSRTIIGVL